MTVVESEHVQGLHQEAVLVTFTMSIASTVEFVEVSLATNLEVQMHAIHGTDSKAVD